MNRQKVESLFHGALERPPAERESWLREACQSDPDVMKEVESLLAHHRDENSGAWLGAAAAQAIRARGCLQTGSRIGGYEMLELIGAGGMGEVYRARDTKLNREVAIKILPDAFSGDGDRLARFSREAHLLASLNHPNVAAIYGVEERALIMELVEGPTLAERIARGPLPIGETLPIARQIAEALECAHEKGIVHRDLKPANIKLTRDGRVKVLDFGLAKAWHNGTTQGSPVSSPTLTIQATTAGVILGTAAYMSPEQARGAEVDRRTDIWAFGLVLYEMLSGRQAFQEATVPETMAAVLKTDPDWSALPIDIPRPTLRLLRRCLEKDPKRRLRDAGDALLDIDEALSPAQEAAPKGGAASWRSWMPWALALLGLVVGGLTTMAWWRRPSAAPGPVMRWTVTEPRAAPRSFVALSPDGAYISYIGTSSGYRQLWVRRTDQREARPITGEDPVDFVDHFFSPDGHWIAYRTRGVLKKVPLAGGTPITLVSGVSVYEGAAWGPDDTIVIGSSVDVGLGRIPAGGGKLERLTTLDRTKGESAHDWPHFLPGGKALLFSVKISGHNWNDARIDVLILRTGERRTLIEGGTSPRYAESGHLIYTRAGSVFAAPFDPDTLQVTGPAAPVMEGLISTLGSGLAGYSWSRSGDLVYMRTAAGVQDRQLVWVDRKGAVTPIDAPSRPYGNPSVSPDGNRIALNIASESQTTFDVWVYDVAHRTLERRTFNGNNLVPIWTPDGKRITFRRFEAGENGIYWIPADGSGSPEKLIDTPLPATPCSWTADSKTLLYYQGLPLGTEAWILPMQEAEGGLKPLTPQLLIQPRAYVPQLSPDGRWVAYSSYDSGKYELFVQPYAGAALGGKWQISTDGGHWPRWARNGRELFYRSDDKMMAVEVQTGSTFSFGTPRVLFTGNYEGTIRGVQSGVGYDVSPDGKRFLMVKSDWIQDTTGQIEVIHNWFEDLRTRVPSRR